MLNDCDISHLPSGNSWLTCKPYLWPLKAACLLAEQLLRQPCLHSFRGAICNAMASDEAIAATQGEGAIPFKPLCTAAAWSAATAAAEQHKWVTVLSPAEVAELLTATKHALTTGKPIQVRCRSEVQVGRS